MKPSPSSDNDEVDRRITKLLKDLGSSEVNYPPELLAARRATFLSQVEQLSTADSGEALSAGDQEIVKLLGKLKSAQGEYPPELLAARRSAFLSQMKRAGTVSLLDELRLFINRIFQYKTSIPTVPPARLMRISLVTVSLAAAVFIGSLLAGRIGQAFIPSPSEVVVEPAHLLPTNTGEVAIIICEPDDQTPACPPGELDPSQDLADAANGPARPAVSKDAQSSQDGVHRAAYVNDGHGGVSWVSNSPGSWIKVDLGQVQTINTVSLQKGDSGTSNDNNPGQFVIAVALSDVYADGDSSNDYSEYAQIFNSEQAGFSGTVARTETMQAQFPAVPARFVKITFEKAGAAIEEIGVFMVRPPVLAEQPTRTPEDDLPGIALSPISTNTSWVIGTATSVLAGSQQPTDTAVPSPTDTPLPTNTQTPTDTSTPVPTDPLPSDTPVSLPTVVPPTIIPPTAIAPPVQPPPVSTEPIIVTGNGQILTFTCNGNAAEIRGHANTVMLLGSCSSITVKGNDNRVFWEYGSPVITNQGRDNIIEQL